MDRRSLGRTGVMVSPLGLGTVKFGRVENVKYARAFTLPDDRELRELLALARDLGINLIDTAPAYGTSELRIGRLLPPPRSEWVIVTKVGESFCQGKSTYDFSGAAVKRSVETSLGQLRTDYIDCVLIHSDGRDLHILSDGGALAALADLKEAGLIRSFGMSTKTPDGGLAAVKRCDVVMVTYNLCDTSHEQVLCAAESHGCGVLVKKGFASGHLSTLGVQDPVGASVEHVLSAPGVSSLIVGTINPDHLRANAAAVQRHWSKGNGDRRAL